ncbi:hypothetical protein [Sphingomonas sp. 3-13AW]|uniref:hypothetical protein n=1 Tax=Sphingomonas sp. 3-13AW TaxID=3050450 RepID=UPI003BB5ADBB
MSGGEEELAAVRRMAREIVADLGGRYPETNAHDTAAAVAIALGVMVAAQVALGGVKPGRGGHVLRHLFDMAELTAEGCLQP